MSELNPNHPVTMQMHDMWHKIVALLVMRSGGKAIISPSEVKRFADDNEGSAVTIRFDDSLGIILQIVDDEEAERLARKEGGLPA